MNNYFKPIVEQHEKEFNEQIEPRDYIYAFIKARQQRIGKYFHVKQLMSSVSNLFAAGTETTSTTIRWAILLLATHPQIQEKVHKELATVVGKDRFPQLSDRQNLPYLEAVILEVLRFGSLVALTQRLCIRECKVAGYTIPEGSPVIINLFAAHMDPEKFPEPMKFDPNRFFDAEAKKTCNAELLLAFGAGKRVCLGESLARVELFLFIAALFHCFEFRFPNGISAPKLDHQIGITAQPLPYEILAVPRV